MALDRRRCRVGQSLMVVMLLLLVMASVLALTLDFGFVLLSRRTMQAGVNTASLEGARDIDEEGRENARILMRNVYDDDLDPRQNFTTLGAGPEQSSGFVDGNGPDVRFGQITDMVASADGSWAIIAVKAARTPWANRKIGKIAELAITSAAR